MKMFIDYINGGKLRGYGTYQIKDKNIIQTAVDNGYNFFDTAELYKNEDIVIDVIKNNPDKKLFVSTKISYIAIEKGQIEKSFYERLEKFKDLKINLLLLHKPSDNCKRDWDVLLNLYIKYKDKIDYIGVSNYDIRHLEQLDSIHKPLVNQFEVSPFNICSDLVEYCKSNNIYIISHTTLTRTIKFDNNILQYIANKYKVSVSKILLKWAFQNGYITIPRTTKEKHLIDNIEIYSFNISLYDMHILNKNLDEKFTLTKIRY